MEYTIKITDKNGNEVPFSDLSDETIKKMKKKAQGKFEEHIVCIRVSVGDNNSNPCGIRVSITGGCVNGRFSLDSNLSISGCWLDIYGARRLKQVVDKALALVENNQ